VTSVTVTALNEPTGDQLADVAELFDEYRKHYRQAVVPGQTLAWMRSHIGVGQLNIFAAHAAQNLVGVATTVSIPASLTLSCFWQLRDLYVMPGARRQGVAGALVGAVRAAAEAAGAIRVSVLTEPGNAAALRLYGANGFLPEEDLCVLSLPLQHGA
jgi:GNAT superfamily N-acetyltransferase